MLHSTDTYQGLKWGPLASTNYDYTQSILHYICYVLYAGTHFLVGKVGKTYFEKGLEVLFTSLSALYGKPFHNDW